MASRITSHPRRRCDVTCPTAELLDRLLNDPEVILEPHKVWDLVEALAYECGLTPRTSAVARPDTMPVEAEAREAIMPPARKNAPPRWHKPQKTT
jgi:hypothetical protein